jgi:uncharacterized repeat protein (TIGR03803 family)
MRISHLGRYALNVCAAAVLAGCGGGSGTPLSPSPAGPSCFGGACPERSRRAQHDITAFRVITAQRTRPSVKYGVLYRFKGGKGDGAKPEAGLLNVNGTLYGTTRQGGASHYHYGTVFSITNSGTETLLHSFGGGDGGYPEADLLNVKGTLYGTTYIGGGASSSIGTVFSITPSGTETVLHSFAVDSGDGLEPAAGLLNVEGTLYGTTEQGGANCSGSFGCGTVFAITLSGTETVLHSFGGTGDGGFPKAGLLNVNGTLYGTTAGGGANGHGTVFSITTSGTETVLYSFKGGTGDGGYPEAGLLNVNGTLYGTTAIGGTNNGGTVFSITTSGTEAVLYSFKGGTGDGESPAVGLLNVEGTLYGTTAGGGANGHGTVFSITPSGAETVLYSFKGGKDGKEPSAGLLNIKGTLYGTTELGGGSGCGKGCGTIFSLSP